MSLDHVDRLLEVARERGDAPSLDALVSAAKKLSTAEVRTFLDQRMQGRHVREAWAAHIRRRELEQALALHASGDPDGWFEGEGFGAAVYARVEDMFLQPGSEACRQFVMVGCGPLPATLVHAARRLSNAGLLGIDADPEATASASRLLAKANLGRVRIETVDGRRHDYREADLVYIANLVTPKRAILERVVETAPPHVSIVLRDPAGLGALLAEVGVHDIDARLRVTGTGSTASRFLSRHVFLRRAL